MVTKLNCRNIFENGPPQVDVVHAHPNIGRPPDRTMTGNEDKSSVFDTDDDNDKS